MPNFTYNRRIPCAAPGLVTRCLCARLARSESAGPGLLPGSAWSVATSCPAGARYAEHDELSANGPPHLRRRCGGPFLLHRQQLEDLHRELPVTVGQEREAVGERLRSSEIVGLDDRVADQVAGCSFSAVIANGRARPERVPLENRIRLETCGSSSLRRPACIR